MIGLNNGGREERKVGIMGEWKEERKERKKEPIPTFKELP